jgi:hypothetical protein
LDPPEAFKRRVNVHFCGNCADDIRRSPLMDMSTSRIALHLGPRVWTG